MVFFALGVLGLAAFLAPAFMAGVFLEAGFLAADFLAGVFLGLASVLGCNESNFRYRHRLLQESTSGCGMDRM